MATHIQPSDGYTMITGGAGFIGTNLAHRLLSAGEQVLVYDNLSREGVRKNLLWLSSQHGKRLQIRIADINDHRELAKAVRSARQVYHLAAQVAVTTSLVSPAHDFDVNLKGTFRLLETIRKTKPPPPLVFTSTNKVYGNLDAIPLIRNNGHHEPVDGVLKSKGIDEGRPLEFLSPYGCSKGAADQYFLDYARSYDLPAVVFRMSCIYGPHQFGTEDQGWVAHFLISAMNHQPITLYGDGCQVRDVLFVEDLVDAFLRAQENMQTVTGRAFNIGGGPENRVALLEMIRMIADLLGRKPRVDFSGWRTGDQKYYVSDSSLFNRMTGWTPSIPVPEGLQQLHDWIRREQRPETPNALNSEALYERLAASSRKAPHAISGARSASPLPNHRGPDPRAPGS
jgi:CDP-paratose 2-epimerase